MAFEKIGDWQRIANLISNLQTDAEESRQISLKRISLLGEKIVKGHISAQDLSWQKLNKDYLAAKIRGGFSDNILVKTSSYFQQITAWTDKETAYIGVKKNSKDKDGNDLVSIAAVHEFGSISAGIPARKLWEPSLAELGKEIKQNPDYYNAANIFLEKLKRR